jgi:hypothetical protein
MLRERSDGAAARGREGMMAEYQFERESRTPFSESYSIEESGDAVGRVDIHFTASSIVYATLCVPADFDEDDVEDLIGEVDERLVLTTDPYRDDFIVTVWRGAPAGVYSEEEEEEEEEEDEEEGNGSNGRVL